MLIHWAWTDTELASFNHIQLTLAAAEILRASRRGHHLVSISRSTARWIRDNLNLADFDKAHLSALIESYSQTGGLKRRALFYVEIAPITHDYDVGDREVRVSLNFVLKANILDQTKLIVENIDYDGWLFELITQNVRKMAGISILSFELSHGGGGDVVRVLSQHMRSQKVSCLIIDSDKKYPSAPKSVTTKKAERIVANGNPFCVVQVLPCHEIENMFPFDIVAALAPSGRRSDLSVLERINLAEQQQSCASAERFWIYFDLKNGVNEDYLAQAKSAENEWHSRKFALANLSAGSRNLDGFGARIIPQIKDRGDLVSKFVAYVKTDEWREIFFDAFHFASWMLAGNVPSRT